MPDPLVLPIPKYVIYHPQNHPKVKKCLMCHEKFGKKMVVVHEGEECRVPMHLNCLKEWYSVHFRNPTCMVCRKAVDISGLYPGMDIKIASMAATGIITLGAGFAFHTISSHHISSKSQNTVSLALAVLGAVSVYLDKCPRNMPDIIIGVGGGALVGGACFGIAGVALAYVRALAQDRSSIYLLQKGLLGGVLGMLKTASSITASVIFSKILLG